MAETGSEQQPGSLAGEQAGGRGRAALTRRRVLGAGVAAFGAGYAGAIAYPLYRYVRTPVVRARAEAAVTEVALPDADQLPRGEALMFRFGTRPAMLIHHPDGQWSAFSAVCTHLGCTVKYLAEADKIHCACHGGEYDSRTGEPTAGPPPKALAAFQVEVRDGEVVVGRG